MKGIRLVGAVVVMLLALGSGIALAEQSGSGETPESPLSTIPSAPGGAELVTARTSTSQTFEFPNGQREDRLYANPVNFRDSEGRWEPIGEGLEEQADGSGLTNGPNRFDVTLPERMGVAPVRLSLGDQWVAARLLGSPSSAVQLEGTDETASYEAGQSETEFDLSTLANGVKEDIAIAGPDAPNRFDFELSASADLTPSLGENGAVEFRDAAGKPVIALPAPTVSDSSPEEPVAPGTTRYELEGQEEGKWRLTVEVDRKWLEAPDRSFPAFLDPTLTVPSPTLDCMIGGTKGGVPVNWGTCGANGKKEMLTAYWAEIKTEEEEWQRSLFRFDLSAIPRSAEIESATFSAYAFESAKNTQGVELREVTRPWDVETTWTEYDKAGDHWTTEGGDYASEIAKVLTSERGTQVGWWKFGLSAKAVQKPVSTGESLSFLAKLIDDKSRECTKTSCTHRVVRFDSSAAEVKEDRPYLSVVYSVPTHKEPIASYFFNEGSGEIAHDGSGNGHDGTLHGAEWAKEGKYGSALRFKALEHAYVSIPDSSSLDFADAFTLEAWVRPDEARSWAPIIAKTEAAEPNFAYLLYARDKVGGPQAQLSDGKGGWVGVEGKEALAINAWSHVAVASDGENIRIYVNGKLAGTEPAFFPRATTSALRIGGNEQWHEYFDGMIDNVRLYDRALSEEEIAKDELEKPAVTSEAASGVINTEATLHGKANPNGTSTSYQFEYGTTTSYGQFAPASAKEVGSGSEAKALSQGVSGLAVGTTYHFRLSASSEAGTSHGEDQTFTTKALPTVATSTATEVKTSKATLHGTVDPNGLDTAYQLEYGTTTSYGSVIPISKKDIGSGKTSVEITESVNGLEPNTAYHFRVQAENAEGKATGADQTFSTPEWAAETEPGSPSTSAYNDIWCIASSNCVAVGSWDASGANQAQIRHWGGSAWTPQEAPVASGASLSDLTGVTCTSSSSCIAVGSYVYEAKDTRTLALGWDGEQWSVISTPNPSGASSSELSEVACSSAETCIAVGKYTDAEGAGKTLAMEWNGASWSIISTPNVSGGSRDELSGVSCRPSYCLAVGSFVNSGEVTKTLAMTWNGEKWTIESTPEPSGAALNQLSDVTCISSTECMAVGTYFDSSGVQKTLILVRLAGGWGIASSPNPSGALSSQLSAVSCTSSSTCTAVGSYKNSSGEALLTLRWNGTSWSEQSIDTESFGAISLEHSSVSCGGSAACQAVGSITYGHGGVRRNLAFGWDGSQWSLTQADAFSRKWHRMSMAPTDSSLSDVHCFETLKECATAGTFTDFSNTRLGHIDVASDKVVPALTGAKSSGIEGIACISSSQCLAVGNYHDSSGVEWGLTLGQDKSGWSVLTTPAPAGAKSSRLAAVSCSSSSECVAIGSYQNASDTRLIFALNWDGSEWSVMTTTPPSGAQLSELLDVACASASNCKAVGRYVDSGGEPHWLTLAWDGEAWSVGGTGTGVEAMASELSGVACPSVSHCFAIGDYVDLEGHVRALAMGTDDEESPGEWSVLDTPSQGEGTTSKLTGIACHSGSSCIAVGAVSEGEGPAPLTLSWDGTEWTDLNLEPPTGVYAWGYQLKAVSCVSSVECRTVGSITTGTEADSEDIAYDIENIAGKWQFDDVDAGGPSSGSVTGVSCPRTTSSAESSCIAVGSHSDPAGAGAMSWVFGETGWTEVPIGITTNALNDVDCSAIDACTAVGSGNNEWIVRRWDGSEWIDQSSPSVGGATTVAAEAVSCASADNCVVSGYSEKEGSPSPLIAAWDGTSWAVESVPTELLGERIMLSDVSCRTVERCIAVGKTESGVHAAVERWDGSTWKAESIPSPSEATTAELSGVACSSPVKCTAVGDYTRSGSSEIRRGLIARWDGTSWLLETSPSLGESGSTSLADVSCFSAAGCVAIAKGQPSSMLAWDGTGWSEETTSMGASGASLEPEAAVSCASAADCMAVGALPSDGEALAPLAIEPSEDRPQALTESSPQSDPPVNLTPVQEEQLEQIVAEDPALQAKLGDANYTLESGPWTENSAENGEILIGAVVSLTLEDPRTWTKPEEWPTVTYDSPIDPQAFDQDTATAAADDISVLKVNVTATTDVSENFVDGEVAQIGLTEVAGGSYEGEPAYTTPNYDFLGY